MDYKTAKTLLERYFAGESSTEEEAQLRRYFQQTDLPQDMKPYRPLFQFFVAAKRQQTNLTFDERTLEQPIVNNQAKRVSLDRNIWSALAIAAMVILAMAVWFLAPVNEVDRQQTAIDWSQYEPKNEEEAIQVTTAAFRKTSTSLRLGLEAATNELKTVRKIVQPF